MFAVPTFECRSSLSILHRHYTRTPLNSLQSIRRQNTAEFFVTVAAATTFFVTLGLAPLQALLGLIVGGVIAAPFGAYVAQYLPARRLMLAVGLLVSGLAAYQIARSLELI